MGRVVDLTEANQADLHPVGKTFGGEFIQLKYPVNEIVLRMREDARASGFKAPLFEIFSGFRSIALQQKLYDKKVAEVKNQEAQKLIDKAKAEGKTLTKAKALKSLKPKEIEKLVRLAVAAPGGSTHQTGAAFDLNLGYPTTFTPENVKAIEATKQYKFMKNKLAPKYKLTQYAPEPWHWECDDECQQNMLNILNEERAVGLVAQRNVILPQGESVENIVLDDGELSENERRLLILNYEAEQRNTKIKAGVTLGAALLGLAVLVRKF